MALTLQFIPYGEIAKLSSIGKIRKLLNIAKQNKIVLLEGRLKREEETELIKTTMEEINADFKGIELAVIYPQIKDLDFLNKLRVGFVNALLGNRQGLTIIGPATIVKEIKRDPNKIQLMTNEKRTRRKNSKRKNSRATNSRRKRKR